MCVSAPNPKVISFDRNRFVIGNYFISYFRHVFAGAHVRARAPPINVHQHLAIHAEKQIQAMFNL